MKKRMCFLTKIAEYNGNVVHFEEQRNDGTDQSYDNGRQEKCRPDLDLIREAICPRPLDE